MPMDISGYLDTKYDILRRTAASENQLRSAQAGLITSQTATNPQEAAAREAQGFGAGAQGQGYGAYMQARAAATPAEVSSEAGLRTAQGGAAVAGAEATRAASGAEYNTPVTPEQQSQMDARRRMSGMPGATNAGGPISSFGQGNGFNIDGANIPRMSDGTSKVPGKGDGTVDTQPAMLAPGEAVLTKPAAEHLGRGVIDVLNAIGTLKMGMDGNAKQTEGPVTKAPIGGEGGIPGYALGTPDILSGSSGQSRVPLAPGLSGGTWGPTGDMVAPSGNTSLRAGLGMGIPRPPVQTPAGPGVKGYAGGTSDVGAVTSNKEPGMTGGRDTVDATPKDASGVSDVTGYPYDTQPPNKQARDSTPKQPGNKPAGYAKGTSKVPGGGKPAGKPSKSTLTPEIMQALAMLVKGGGGMIPPGQGSPMPMPMPQVAPQQGAMR